MLESYLVSYIKDTIIISYSHRTKKREKEKIQQGPVIFFFHNWACHVGMSDLTSQHVNPIRLLHIGNVFFKKKIRQNIHYICLI